MMLSGRECLRIQGNRKSCLAILEKSNQVSLRYMIYSPLCELALLRHADPGCIKLSGDLFDFLQMIQRLFRQPGLRVFTKDSES